MNPFSNVTDVLITGEIWTQTQAWEKAMQREELCHHKPRTCQKLGEALSRSLLRTFRGNTALPTVWSQVLASRLWGNKFLLFKLLQFSSIQFSCSVMTDYLQLHELQHTRPPCPSPTPGVHSNSRPSRRWCHPAISSSVPPFSSLPSIFPSIIVFSKELTLRVRWPKYCSFSFSIILPMNI